MTDLRTRFQALDRLQAPDLWPEIEARAVAQPSAARSLPWLVIAVMLLVAAAIGGVIVASRVIRLPPTVVEPSPRAISTGDLSWITVAGMSISREYHTATSLADGRVVVVGGAPSGSAEIYTPATGSWTDAAQPPIAVYDHTTTRLTDGRVLVVGGRSPHVASDTSHLYDSLRDQWTPTGPLGEARAGHTATLLESGQVLIVGGSRNGDGDALASAERFEVQGATWSAAGAMGTPRTEHTATLLADGRVLVIGGYNTAAVLASAEAYDPDTDTWTSMRSLRDPRAGHTATLLRDGSVVVVGGCLGDAELYDPRSDTWARIRGPAEPRSGHTASLMADGRLLVVGGSGCGTHDPGTGINGPIAATEVYDPATGEWSWAGNLAEARESHAAVVLNDGSVLVVGGYELGGTQGILDSVERFGPAAES